MSFIENLNWRYATKKFDNTKKLTEEEVQKIRDAIRLSPSAYGVQMFKVVEVTDMGLREKMKAASYNQSQITDADRVFVFCSRSDAAERIDDMFTSMSGGNEEIRNTILKGYEDMVKGDILSRSVDAVSVWSSRQAYIALGFALAACAELKIDSCPMEGFDTLAVKNILNLGDEFMPAVYMTVGYRDESDMHLQNPKWRFVEDKIIEKI